MMTDHLKHHKKPMIYCIFDFFILKSKGIDVTALDLKAEKIENTVGTPRLLSL